MPDQKSLKVKCPSCGAEVIWSDSNPYRPFCSARCKDKDFIGWAKEEHRIGGDNHYDDLLSGDLSADDLPER